MRSLLRAASIAGALIVVLAAAPGIAAQVLDGTWTGVLDTFPQDVTELEPGYDHGATVTVSNGTITGREDFRAIRNDDSYGAHNQVQVSVHQWAEWSGPIEADGTFSVPGRSWSEYSIHSCSGDCSQVEAPGGNAEGYPITVKGYFNARQMRGELWWPEQDAPTYAFWAYNDDYQLPTTTSSSTTTTIIIQGSFDAPGVNIIGDVISINSPPDGGVLEISSQDLPPWARDLIARVGDEYLTVGFLGQISGGDDRVLLDGYPIARLGDPTNGGGTIVEGSSLIYVNGIPAATVGSFVVDPRLGGGTVPAVGGPILRDGPCFQLQINRSNKRYCADDRLQPLEEATRRGDTRIRTAEDGTWQIGDGVLIGSDPETADTAIVSGKGSLLLDRPLQFDHEAGEAVVLIPAEYVEQVVPPADEPIDNAEALAEGDLATPREDEGSPPWSWILILTGSAMIGAWWVLRRRSHGATRR